MGYYEQSFDQYGHQRLTYVDDGQPGSALVVPKGSVPTSEQVQSAIAQSAAGAPGGIYANGAVAPTVPGAAASPPAAAPPPTSPGKVHQVPPTHGVPTVNFPVLKPKFLATAIGAAAVNPIVGGILAGLDILAGIFGLGSTSGLKRAIEAVRNAVTDVSNTLMDIVWTFAHNMRWILNALRLVWEKVLKPLLAEIGAVIGRVATIIEKVLKPYLDLIQKIRKHILEIYARWFLPVLAFLQKVRRIVAILRLLHIPGMKQLDQKIARVEGKIIGTLQQIMLAVNSQGGYLNILLTARNTIQHEVLIRSMYETQGAWVNQWWNAQAWDRDPADALAAVDLDLRRQSEPHVKALNDLLTTGVDTSGDVPGPHEQALLAMLNTGVQ